VWIFQQLLAPSPAAIPGSAKQRLRERAKSVVRKLSGQAGADWRHLREQSRRLRDAQLLFYSYIPAYQVDHDGCDYDRVLDPVCRLVGDSVDWQKFHVQGWQPVRDRAQVVPGIALSAACADQIPLTPGPPAECRQVGKLMASLESRLREETGVEIELGDATLWTAAAVRRYRDFFYRVLEGAQTKAVLLPCYYGERQSGLIWACRDLDITTVDIQHGKQGILSMGYGKWPSIPDGGYETMPDMFWVWGHESGANLQLGAPGQTGMPQCRVTGNMYVGQWVHDTPFDYRRADPDFWHRVDASTKVILVTLQPFSVDRALPENLVSAMRASPEGWLWVLRMHPAGRPSPMEIEAWLDRHAVNRGNVVIQESTRHPLYALMRHTNVHVTLWSSCGYEAHCFGVPTLFLDEFARTLYEDYLRKGVFQWASSDAEIMDKIGSVGDGWKVQEDTPYIETDPALTRQALADLVSFPDQTHATSR